MSSRLVEFLASQSGAVEILSSIDVDGTRFGELVDRVAVSRTTVSNRLHEAKELGLVTQEAITDERGTTHKWVLTGKGARLRQVLESEGVVKHYDLIQMYRQNIEESMEDVLEQVEELAEEEDLDDKVENEQALERWKQAVNSRNTDEDDRNK